MKVGDTMVVAFVLLTTTPGYEEKVAKTLKEKDLVKECHVVYGGFDIHLTIEADDLHTLDEFVSQLRHVKGIGNTSTLIAMGG